ncbi:hypothetical protein CLAIMM_13476 [Cladophialophora immunda]|nr:hypothetical protein CLAIMM_13476 [Cladophialophora immunda]
MAKLLVVVGATGGQGGSVIKTLLGNSEWRLRGITRDLNGAQAKRLAAQGAEMVAADLDDLPSLQAAFTGAQAIYGVTNYPGLLSEIGVIEEARVREQAQGTNIARAASEVAGLEHYIWSTLPDSEAISGKEWYIPHFSGKGRVDAYIKNELPALFSKTTLLTLPLYGDNFQYPVVTPRPVVSELSTAISARSSTAYADPAEQKSTGKHVHLVPWSPQCPVTLVGSHKDNVGPVVRAILQQGPTKLGTRHVVAALEETTAEGMLKMWSEVTGKDAVHVQISMADYEKLWPVWATEMAAMYMWWQHEGQALWAPRETELVTLDDLGLTKQDLVSTKQAMQTKDWDALC